MNSRVSEYYADNSNNYAEDAAENWALGIKKLDIL